MKLSMRRFALMTLVVSASLMLASCSTKPQAIMPSGQSSFAQYAEETRTWLAHNRNFVSDNQEQELDFHAPFELKPDHPTSKGILLIHGLSDSPWTFHDLAKKLSAEGFLVRTVILPGHGSKPADMVDVKSKDWERIVNEQMAQLKKDVPEVWIGGFSTGANLAVKYAEQNPDVKGMVLVSPALQVRSKLINVVPFVDLFITWVRKPDEATKGVMLFKYSTAPVDAIAAFKVTMDDSFRLFRKAPYDKPVFVALTEHDSVLDTPNLLKLFDKQLTNPNSKIFWYGELPEGYTPSSKVEARPDYLPEERIKSFSHLSLNFSPDNEWYGRNGKYRMCRNNFSQEAYEKCMEAPEVWYGSWGDTNGDVPVARLTFNPYFDQQAKTIVEVLNAGAEKNPKDKADTKTD